MKKALLLAISLLIADNTCAMDGQEPIEHPHSPRTRFLLNQLNDQSSIGCGIITQELLTEQHAQLAACSNNLFSGLINNDQFRSQVAGIKSTMYTHSQDILLLARLSNSNYKRTLLLTVIEAEERILQENLAQAKLAFTRAKSELAQACTDACRNGTWSQGFEPLTNTVNEQCARIRQLNQSLYQLDNLRRL